MLTEPFEKSRPGIRKWLVLLVLWPLVLSGCPRPLEESGQPTHRGNQHIESFAQAKKHIYRLSGSSARTFYCNCRFTKRQVDHSSCGYVPQKANKRAKRTEIEHVVPAHAFGKAFAEWRDGHPECRNKSGQPFKGRNCARKASKAFRRMEADLFNLKPVIGEVNARRKHFTMTMISGERREFGACDFEVGERRVEPRPAVRGDIARTYLYMNWAYPNRGIISSKQRKLYEAWAVEDPVDESERAWVEALARVQGNRNPFVQDEKQPR